MSAPPFSKITTRDQFDEMLAQAIADTRAMQAKEPDYPVWALILRHLQGAAKSLENGGTPTKAQRDSFMVGTIATRELEPAHDPDRYELTQKLHELQYYYQVHLK